MKPGVFLATAVLADIAATIMALTNWVNPGTDPTRSWVLTVFVAIGAVNLKVAALIAREKK